MTQQNCEVLLIDDDPNDIELALLAFARCNIAPLVHAVNDGGEALNSLQGWAENSRMGGRCPQLVILDLKMPKVDGFEILAGIRKSRQFNRVPVVILTSSRMPADIEKAYALGCNAYVVKPVGHQEYTRMIEKLAGFWCESNLTPQA